ncbi:amino acid ABC transporter [Rhizobium sp. Root149]|jgi:polar amino acid transport system substrate-binding protein|uniref:Polar amino acid transport system substrate-binding protein n=1 Tax=Rhizobium rhizoryzae TaxID=451876 RepID=A0A7W6LIJ6_9HYPH|nr:MULTISPECIES: transporter substrate-binding domain-containing protein [Rhizobium]KQZ48880.1 amino acid ABC transporter [Rhizobium sp. Root149]MBB4145010.1 polar amino acid transport system substrate-binding protein [Rhizobium rhizoryzae]
MLKRHFLKAAACAAFFLGASLSAHAEDILAKAKAAGTLKVGTETAFAPFDFIDAGTHSGLNVDLFAEIGKELGVKIEWVTLPWEGVLPGLEAGKFDVVAGPATITKARMERYRFTSPIAEATVAILKKAGAPISKPEDIAGKAVGVGKATAQLAQLTEFSATLPTKVDIREYPAFNDAYADMAAGRIVAVANSLPNIAFVAKQRAGMFEVVQPPFGKKTYFGYVGRKDADYAPLMDAIDAALIKMKGDGRMAKLQEKWFGTKFDTPDTVKEPAI